MDVIMVGPRMIFSERIKTAKARQDRKTVIKESRRPKHQSLIKHGQNRPKLEFRTRKRQQKRTHTHNQREHLEKCLLEKPSSPEALVQQAL